MQTIMSYFEQGGVIMYILLALNVIGWSVMIYKAIQLMIIRTKYEAIADSLLKSGQNSVSTDRAYLLEKSKDRIAAYMITLEKGLGIVKSIASIAPLLGLLGTVVGVLIAFETISQKGMDDPSIFAGGIAMALVTTVAGLIVAIPHYLGYNFLIGMLDRLEAKFIQEAGDRI